MSLGHFADVSTSTIPRSNIVEAVKNQVALMSRERKSISMHPNQSQVIRTTSPIVRNMYLKCGHAVNLPEQEVSCENVRCKFSPFIPPIVPIAPGPAGNNPNINSFCPSCQALGYR
ncbi:hypothetical protein BT96DRAFT_985298 [Gymnopus androsaceus JB14]|uniref:Uncharacterized protein n=1 Tax=Gymnopus androsaceus JB14 TaxID=1447944 RepID=A0A6A4IEH9_9AGAR|nr:hypothetical protein BT96DRAFT_985298 [Gymnopus androsaceus JB14]